MQHGRHLKRHHRHQRELDVRAQLEEINRELQQLLILTS
jgi:hypothetical protein